VSQRDVVDVEQDLLLALPIPYLMSGVPGIGEDRPHRALRPRDAAAVPVPIPDG
jgi:hypothetical protein